MKDKKEQQNGRAKKRKFNELEEFRKVFNETLILVKDYAQLQLSKIDSSNVNEETRIKNNLEKQFFRDLANAIKSEITKEGIVIYFVDKEVDLKNACEKINAYLGFHQHETAESIFQQIHQHLIPLSLKQRIKNTSKGILINDDLYQWKTNIKKDFFHINTEGVVYYQRNTEDFEKFFDLVISCYKGEKFDRQQNNTKAEQWDLAKKKFAKLYLEKENSEIIDDEINEDFSHDFWKNGVPSDFENTHWHCYERDKTGISRYNVHIQKNDKRAYASISMQSLVNFKEEDGENLKSVILNYTGVVSHFISGSDLFIVAELFRENQLKGPAYFIMRFDKNNFSNVSIGHHVFLSVVYHRLHSKLVVWRKCDYEFSNPPAELSFDNHSDSQDKEYFWIKRFLSPKHRSRMVMPSKLIDNILGDHDGHSTSIQHWVSNRRPNLNEISLKGLCGIFYIYQCIEKFDEDDNDEIILKKIKKNKLTITYNEITTNFDVVFEHSNSPTEKWFGIMKHNQTEKFAFSHLLSYQENKYDIYNTSEGKEPLDKSAINLSILLPRDTKVELSRDPNFLKNRLLNGMVSGFVNKTGLLTCFLGAILEENLVDLKDKNNIHTETLITFFRANRENISIYTPNYV